MDYIWHTTDSVDIKYVFIKHLHTDNVQIPTVVISSSIEVQILDNPEDNLYVLHIPHAFVT